MVTVCSQAIITVALATSVIEGEKHVDRTTCSQTVIAVVIVTQGESISTCVVEIEKCVDRTIHSQAVVVPFYFQFKGATGKCLTRG